METFKIPETFQQEIVKIQNESKQLQEDFEKAQNLLKQIGERSRVLQGQFEGTIRAVAIMADFDLKENIKIDEAFTELTGVKIEKS